MRHRKEGIEVDSDMKYLINMIAFLKKALIVHSFIIGAIAVITIKLLAS